MQVHSIKSVDIEFIGGTDLEDAVKAAIALAKKLNVEGPVKFTFNYVNMEAYTFSNVEYLIKYYNHKLGLK